MGLEYEKLNKKMDDILEIEDMAKFNSAVSRMMQEIQRAHAEGKLTKREYDNLSVKRISLTGKYYKRGKLRVNYPVVEAYEKIMIKGYAEIDEKLINNFTLKEILQARKLCQDFVADHSDLEILKLYMEKAKEVYLLEFRENRPGSAMSSAMDILEDLYTYEVLDLDRYNELVKIFIEDVSSY